MATINVSATGTNDGTAINAVISGASSGDTILLADGTYDIDTTINMVAGIGLQGASKTGTVLLANAAIAASSSIIYANGADACPVSNLTIDGNGSNVQRSNISGLHYRNSDDHIVSDLLLKDIAGHTLMFYGSQDCTIDAVTSTRSATVTSQHYSVVDSDISYSAPSTINSAGAADFSSLAAGDVIATNAASTNTNDRTYVVASANATTIVVVETSITTEDAVTAGAVTLKQKSTSHGVDIDEHAGTSRASANLAFTNCTLQNGNALAATQSTKVENATGVTYTGCVFNSEVVYGDNGGGSVTQAIYDACTFDALLVVSQRAATSTLTVQNSTFTDNGGCIRIDSDVQSTPAFNNNTFLGRNKIVGFNGVGITSVSNYTESGNVHDNVTPSGGVTMFASIADSGADKWGDDTNNTPYLTPNTAHTSLETLVENANLDGLNRTYALLSAPGTHTYADSDISFASAVRMDIEGYPDRATIDMSVATSDLFSTSNFAGGEIRNLNIINLVNAAHQAFRFAGGSGTIRSVTVDGHAAAGSGGGAEIRDGAHVDLIDFECKNFTGTGTHDGNCVYVLSASTQCNIIGGKFADNTVRTGAIRFAAGIDASSVVGTEFTNNHGTGSSGGLFVQDADVALDNLTFDGNTCASGSAVDCYTTVASVVRNSIISANANLGGTGTYTLTSCLIGDGLGGTHTDGGNNVTGTPTYVDSANDDYNLTAASAGLNVGAMGVSLFKQGRNGEPFPGFDVDIGANQSTHGPFHPVNL